MCSGEEADKLAKFKVWDKVSEGSTLIIEDVWILL